MSGYYGDYPASASVRLPFNTNAAAGSRVDPNNTFETSDVFIYKDGGATERTSAAGLVITSPFDSKTGSHMLTIDTSDNTDAGFYASGHDYSVLLYPDETVDGLAVGAWLGSFSIENRSALRPTTAGRTLDVSAAGEAGVDWANVGSPTTTLNLSGTTIKTSTDIATAIVTVQADTDDIQTRLTTVQADTDDIQTRLTTLQADTDDIQTRLPAALVSGRMSADAVAISGSTTTADNVETAFASTIAELSAVPAANAPLWTAIKWMFMKSRNLVTETATTQIVKADNGTTTVATSTVSDDNTTATRGKFA